MGTTTEIGAAARRRLFAALAALALMAGTVLLIQQQAAGAQIGGAIGDLFQSIVCPILLAVRNAFADGPFGGFVTTIINQFLVAFGCAPSG